MRKPVIALKSLPILLLALASLPTAWATPLLTLAPTEEVSCSTELHSQNLISAWIGRVQMARAEGALAKLARSTHYLRRHGSRDAKTEVVVKQWLKAAGFLSLFEKLSYEDRIEFSFLLEAQDPRSHVKGDRADLMAFTFWKDGFLDTKLSTADRFKIWDRVVNRTSFYGYANGAGTLPGDRLISEAQFGQLPALQRRITPLAQSIKNVIRLRRENPKLSMFELAKLLDKENAATNAAWVRTVTKLDTLTAAQAQFADGHPINWDSPQEVSEDLIAGAQAAHQIELQGLSTGDLTPEELGTLRFFAGLWEKFLAESYAGDNALLLNHTVTEPLYKFTASVDTMVRGDRELRQWAWSSAVISAKKSLSSLARQFGQASNRTVYWMYANVIGNPGQMELDNYRLNVNSTNEADGSDKRRSKEIFFNVPGEGWQPFYYARMGNDWVPRHEVLGVPVKVFCAECHMGPDGKFSPLPVKILAGRPGHLETVYPPGLVEQIEGKR